MEIAGFRGLHPSGLHWATLSIAQDFQMPVPGAELAAGAAKAAARITVPFTGLDRSDRRT